jgi:hypothetical protein
MSANSKQYKTLPGPLRPRTERKRTQEHPHRLALPDGDCSISVFIKETVSPGRGVQFRFGEIKSVLSAGPLSVITFFYFVVPKIFKSLLLNCFYESTY